VITAKQIERGLIALEEISAKLTELVILSRERTRREYPAIPENQVAEVWNIHDKEKPKDELKTGLSPEPKPGRFESKLTEARSSKA
jgi:hypothetical protein